MLDAIWGIQATALGITKILIIILHQRKSLSFTLVSKLFTTQRGILIYIIFKRIMNTWRIFLNEKYSAFKNAIRKYRLYCKSSTEFINKARFSNSASKGCVYIKKNIFFSFTLYSAQSFQYSAESGKRKCLNGTECLDTSFQVPSAHPAIFRILCEAKK